MNEWISTIPRFYTAIAQWLSCMVFIVAYWNQRRLKGWKFAVTAVLALVVLSLELILTDRLHLMFWIPSMIGSAVLMFVFMLLCCNMPWATVGYYCVRAFVFSELAASIEWQLYCYCLGFGMDPGELLKFAFMAVVFLLVNGGMLLLERGVSKGGMADTVHLREFVSALCIGVAVFAISNLSFVTANTPFSGSVAREVFTIRTFVDLGGVAVLFAHNMQHRELQARYELTAIESVLETQYSQYKTSRDSIELINRKYHDLKHQIAALRAEPDPRRRAAWLDAMEGDIDSYEAQSNTGNTVLDTVITSKNLYCQKHKISLTCVVDGMALRFLDAMDICTIFGNALDNAIEAVLQIPQKEKRLIHLTAAAQKGFLLIRVENYFEGSIKFDAGNPVSTKGDDRFHGYGIKSIRYSAQRYGGSVSIDVKKNWFDLKVLLPIPETE